jgi:hypothetical protein
MEIMAWDICRVSFSKSILIQGFSCFVVAISVAIFGLRSRYAGEERRFVAHVTLA